MKYLNKSYKIFSLNRIVFLEGGGETTSTQSQTPETQNPTPPEQEVVTKNIESAKKEADAAVKIANAEGLNENKEAKNKIDMIGMMDEIKNPNLTPERKSEIEGVFTKLIRHPSNPIDKSTVNLSIDAEGKVLVTVNRRYEELKYRVNDEGKNEPYYLITKATVKFTLERHPDEKNKLLATAPEIPAQKIDPSDEKFLAQGLYLTAMMCEPQ